MGAMLLTFLVGVPSSNCLSNQAWMCAKTVSSPMVSYSTHMPYSPTPCVHSQLFQLLEFTLKPPLGSGTRNSPVSSLRLTRLSTSLRARAFVSARPMSASRVLISKGTFLGASAAVKTDWTLSAMVGIG